MSCIHPPIYAYMHTLIYVPLLHIHTPNSSSLYINYQNIRLHFTLRLQALNLKIIFAQHFQSKDFAIGLLINRQVVHYLATLWIIYSHQFKSDFLYLHKQSAYIRNSRLTSDSTITPLPTSELKLFAIKFIRCNSITDLPNLSNLIDCNVVRTLVRETWIFLKSFSWKNGVSVNKVTQIRRCFIIRKGQMISKIIFT